MKNFLSLVVYSVLFLFSCSTQGVVNQDKYLIKQAVGKFVTDRYKENKPLILFVNNRKSYASVVVAYVADSLLLNTFSFCCLTKMENKVIRVSLNGCNYKNVNYLINNDMFENVKYLKSDSLGFMYDLDENEDFVSFRVRGNAKIIKNKLIFL